mgnify:CR=1 FL=1
MLDAGTAGLIVAVLLIFMLTVGVHIGVALGLGRVPVRAFPVVADNLAQRIVGRQRYPNAEVPGPLGRVRLDEVVLMAVIQGVSRSHASAAARVYTNRAP